MEIAFNGEAYETFQNVLARLSGLVVEVTPEDGEQYDLPFDAQLIGPDLDAEWGDTVRVRSWNEDTADAEGDPFSIRAKRILVF